MPRRTDAERAPGQMESAGCGTGALGRVGGGAKTENLTLLFFEFLLLYNVCLHFRLSPAVEVGLTLPGDAKSLRGNVLGDGAAGGGVGPVADGDGGDKVGVAADEAVVADLSAELVVVAGDGAAAEITVLAYIAVADVGQVADGVAPGKVGVLRLDISAQMHTVAGDGVDAHMGEGADVVVGAEVAAVATLRLRMSTPFAMWRSSTSSRWASAASSFAFAAASADVSIFCIEKNLLQNRLSQKLCRPPAEEKMLYPR